MAKAFFNTNNMKSRKIAGVSVNLECLPTREKLIERALTTKEYIYKRNALELINKEIDGSKLFTNTVRKTKAKKKRVTKTNRGTDNNKQS